MVGQYMRHSTDGQASVKANHRLHDERIARGWTEDDVAAGLDRVAVELGEPPPRVDASHVSKWARGIRTPGRHYAPRLCLLFEVPPDRLGFDPTPRLLAECARLYDLRRRILLAGQGVVASPTLDPSMRPASGMAAVEALEACIADYWRRDDRYGGETLCPAVAGQLNYVL